MTAERLRKPAAAVLVVVPAAPLNSDAFPLESCTGVVVVRIIKGSMLFTRASNNNKQGGCTTHATPSEIPRGPFHTQVGLLESRRDALPQGDIRAFDVLGRSQRATNHF